MLDKLQAPFKGRKGRPELVDVLRKERGGDNTASVAEAEQVAAELATDTPTVAKTGSQSPPAEQQPQPVPAPAPPQPSPTSNAKPKKKTASVPVAPPSAVPTVQRKSFTRRG